MKNAWTCDVQKLKASWEKTQSNPISTHINNQAHTSKMHET